VLEIEHGFVVSTDFFAGKQPDVCPGQTPGQQSVAAVANDAAAMSALIRKLVDKHVALTSTLTVFENLTPHRPMPPGLEVLLPDLRQQFERSYNTNQTRQTPSVYAQLFPKELALERAFVKAGGLLVAGTDPTGAGGVVPGFADQRQVELLVEAGFSPLEAITICTMNGAKYLGRDSRIGSLAVGKQADLVVVAGDPSANISDIRRVETVFRLGLGFDPAKLVASVTGKAGLW
jgi:enamidase